MELFLIILILTITTRYSVWIYFARQHTKRKVTVNNNLGIDENIFLSWLKNIFITDEKISLLVTSIGLEVYESEVYVYSIIIALLSQWHVLIQWAPWTWKTSLVRSFANACDLWYWRIQCTPDLLPQDVLWSEILHVSWDDFVLRKWPLFSHVVHVDEINRTTPKLQSAFLEAMQEWHVTVWLKTIDLPKPFLIIATQNPYDALGTFMLPYAQVDRFMIWVSTETLSIDKTVEIMKQQQNQYLHVENTWSPIFHTDDILKLQNTIQDIVLDDSIIQYCVSCIQYLKDIGFELSLRTTKSLILATKCIAYMQWKKQIDTLDVQRVLLPILRHRMSYIAGMQLSDQQIYALMIWSVWKDDIVG